VTPQDVQLVAEQLSVIQFGLSALLNLLAFAAGLLVFQ
jgi:hypothetical protein